MDDGRPRANPRLRAAAGARRGGLATAILLAPACMLFAVFVIYPILSSLRLSFYDWNGVGAMTFVGLDNYRELGEDPVFAKALANNLRWLACYAVAPLAGIGLAVMLRQAGFGLRVARTLFFLPFVVSQVIVGLVFGAFFSTRFGLLNRILEAVGLPPVAPLDSETWSLYPMILAGLWPQIAYCFILYLTGLAALQQETVDAARVDGARGLPLFRHIVLPQLRGIHYIVAMVCAVAALRSFDYVVIMTLGGPYDSSTVLAYYMYEQTFLAQRYGYGAAVAVVLLSLMSGIIATLLWHMFRRERA